MVLIFRTLVRSPHSDFIKIQSESSLLVATPFVPVHIFMGKFDRDQGASPHPAGTIGQPAATGPHPAAKPVFFSSIKRCDGNWSLDHPSSKGAPRSRGPAQTSALAVLCAQQHSRAPARERNHLTHATCARPMHDVLCAQLSAIRLHCVRSRCAKRATSSCRARATAPSAPLRCLSAPARGPAQTCSTAAVCAATWHAPASLGASVGLALSRASRFCIGTHCRCAQG